MQFKNSNILVVFGILFILSSISPLTGADIFSKFTIALEIVFMIWCFIKYRDRGTKLVEVQFFLTVISLFLFHFVVNPSSDKETFVKVLCPIVFFFAGKKVKMDHLSSNSIKKTFVLITICALPFLVRVLQLAVNVPSSQFYSIFVNSNNFSYFFIVSSILVYASFNKKLFFYSYLATGFILSKTIGALVGLLGGYVISARRMLFTPRFLAGGLIILSALYILIFHSGIEIFERVRTTYITFNALTQSNSSLQDLTNIEYGDAINYTSSGQNDLSFLFRIKNWTEIINAFVSSETENILLGNGLMSVPKITSTHLVAHNDYLGLVYELGILLSCILIFGYWKVVSQLKARELNFIFYSIAIYHFTENLYYNFLITSLHFYLLGTYSNDKTRLISENSSHK